MSFKRIKHPSEVAKEGDTLRLVVLSLDPLARRMSFSHKQAMNREPEPEAPVEGAKATDVVPAPPPKKKKGPPLRGGLDF
jgi:ribosomal protein S1